MSKTKHDPHQTIMDYCAAYRAANNKTPPVISYENGWFKLRGQIGHARWRHRDIKGSTDRLNARIAEK